MWLQGGCKGIEGGRKNQELNRVSEMLSYRDAERRGLTTEDAEGTEGGKRAKARELGIGRERD